LATILTAIEQNKTEIQSHKKEIVIINKEILNFLREMLKFVTTISKMKKIWVQHHFTTAASDLKETL
jgi:hypothetical protein